ncbi:MAG: DUF3617 family protein [Hyphomicrobiaceae bacterium]|nr:DUF3617 family protein [Hyphomicrobiaceae bacterium]
MRRILAALIVVVAAVTPAIADDGLTAGAYEIEVTLELPYVVDTNTRKFERLCLGPERSDTLGLMVLSNNNPLGKCPTSNAKSSTSRLSFDVACPGVNAATGHALYEIRSDGFQGRIDMKMGGKNMTMTEVQVGHRIGTCDMLRTH